MRACGLDNRTGPKRVASFMHTGRREKATMVEPSRPPLSERASVLRACQGKGRSLGNSHWKRPTV
eukprot:9455166-Alexandrium_andersonii.AAC.1